MPIQSNDLIIKVQISNLFSSIIDQLNKNLIFQYCASEKTTITHVTNYKINDKWATVKSAAEFTTKQSYYTQMEGLIYSIGILIIDSARLLNCIQKAFKYLAYFRKTTYQIYYVSDSGTRPYGSPIIGIGVYNNIRSTNTSVTSCYMGYDNRLLTTDAQILGSAIVDYFNSIMPRYLNWKEDSRNAQTINGYVCHSSCHDNCYHRSRR